MQLKLVKCRCFGVVVAYPFIVFLFLFPVVRQFNHAFRVEPAILDYDNIELDLITNKVNNTELNQREISLKVVTEAADVSNHTKNNKTEMSTILSPSPSPSLQISSSSLPSSPFVKLPTPIFVVGMPKSGTTTIYEMFKCAGLNAMHYCCCGSTTDHFPCTGGSAVGRVMMKNLKHNRSILHNVGPYDVWAQMDSDITINGNPPQGSLFLPQHYHLNELHESYPNATFILNLRPKKDWALSVRNWFQMARRFQVMYYENEHKQPYRHKFLMDFYTNHTKRVEEFVQSHPSHKLITVNIYDPAAGQQLSDAFGIPAKCWGHHNNRLHDKNKRN